MTAAPLPTQVPPYTYPRRDPHPICVMLRRLRTAAGLSLTKVQEEYGITAVVLGSYERGDRVPSLHRADAALRVYGYRLAAVPIDDEVAQRMPEDMVASLRTIANSLERALDLHEMSDPSPAD
jgi:transcriptional regulator with XRE-family HTH domain